MSESSENLEVLLKKISAVEELCLGAKKEINDFLKKDEHSEEYRKNFTEKLRNCVNSLHDEAIETKNLANQTCRNVSNKNEDETEGNKENETENSKEWKPRLKIVDFSKLVDPRNLELMDKNQEKKKQEKSSSIIILSSSDDEVLIKNKTVNRSISENIKTTGKRKTTTIVKSTCVQKNSIKNEENTTKINTKKYKESKSDDVIKMSQTKPYVKLLRVPCEEMKTFYSKQSTNTSKKSSRGMLDEKTGLIVDSSSSSDEAPLISKDSQRKTNSTLKIAEQKEKSKDTEKAREESEDSDIIAEKIAAKKPGAKISLSMRKKKTKNSTEDSSDEEILNVENRSRRIRDNKKKSSDEGSESKNSERSVRFSSPAKDSSDSEVFINNKSKELINSSCDETDKTKNVDNLCTEDIEESLLLKDPSNKSLEEKGADNEDISHVNNLQNDSSQAPDKSDNGKNNALQNGDKSIKSIENSKRSETTARQNSEEDMFPDSEVQNNEENAETIDKIISSESEGETVNKPDGSDSDNGNKRAKNDDSSSNDSDDFASFCKKKSTLQLKKSKRVKAVVSDSEDEFSDKKSGKGEESEEDTKNSSDDEKNQKKTGKKRRIQRNDDSSESDSKSTRKKIKKLKSLSDTTKKAAAEEKERKQRILEKQKKYNQIYENLELASSTVDKLILDVDEKTGKSLIQVADFLVSKLKPHQASGVQFMWDACFESVERAKTSVGSGCILAHCMGLGKTLQVITLTNTLLENQEKTSVKKVLIVCPLSTVINWKNEFSNWLSGDEDYQVFEMASCRTANADRASYIKNWHLGGGVMIMSYAMFRNLSNNTNRRVSKKCREIFTEGLVDPGPDIVICDEGHLLKNEKTSLSISMNKVKTRRRIVLTGTPLQNNLKEYYCMVQFVKPNLLGTYKEYLNRFVNPISNGQYTDSTQYDIDIMRRRAHVLHKLLDGIVQRRDYSVLSPYLPPKYEYVVFLTLSDVQRKLYEHYMTHSARKSDGTNRTSFLFQDFQNFSRICIHPRVLLDKSAEDQLKYKSDDEDDSGGSLKDFIDDGNTTTSSSSSESSSESVASHTKKKKKNRRVTRAQRAANDLSEESDVEEIQPEKEWWQEYCDGEELDNIVHSTKLLMLFEILKECEQIGDKVLVFSQSLYALNVIEYFLAKVDEATQNGDAAEKTCGYTGSWTLGLDYFRLDGSTNCALRAQWCDSFNKESNSRARLFLLSTRAGGLGINLVAANRVIIFDVSWNPSSDVQSIYRVYRFGQLKPSYIYRFVVYGTMEMKIYERQVTKQAISKRVIDEQQIDRHYNQHDLAELYKFEVPSIEDRPIPMVPKDVLLGELLQNKEELIFKYHEHQSLLENKEDETLNEEERKAAWEEFENEKVQRTKQSTFIGKFSISTVQLALRSIIQRDNPSWNVNQILSIIPQLTQQVSMQIQQGDFNMYNRIAIEIKRMQEEYSRKVQLQYQQQRLNMEAQRLLAYQNQLPNLQTPQMNLFQQLLSNVNTGAGPSRLNPNVIELN